MFDCIPDGQMTLFEIMYPTFKIDKPVRLIELFAGVGSQAMALRDLGVNFEHYRVVEFDKYAIASYNAIHGTNFPTIDIRDIKGEDLGITETDKYCYIMTYSFPCQDLSLAGKRQGMTKGSGTRSGLLWEVERLLNEVKELPQVLLMENVPQVISDANIKDFHLWQDFLESKGYTNYVEILNAKDYGVAQNRERCFMVSLLGKWNYKFPQPIPLTKTMKDYLEDEVDEKYYINSEKAQKLIEQLIESGQLEGCVGNINPSGNGINGNVFGQDGLSPTPTTNKGEGFKICTDLSINNPKVTDVSNCITERQDRGISNHQGVGGAVINEVKQIGNYETESTWDNPQTGRVYSADGLSPTLNTCSGGDRQPKIVEPQIKQVGNLTENAKRDNPQRRRVYDTTGISPALCEQMGTGGNLQPFIVASRGGNPQNPSDRTPGNYVEQRLEPNSQGICNTLTSVQKDNLVLERKDIKRADRYCEYCGTKLERKRFNSKLEDFNVFLNRKYCDRECMRKAYLKVGFTNANWSNAHASARNINNLILKKDSCEICGSVENLDIHHKDGNWRNNNLDNLQCLCRSCHIKTERNKQIEYRIRKLTPRETWRLMDFTDKDYDKAAAVNSNTQLYKQAGNSIVRAVLMAIFRQMLPNNN